MYLVFAACLSPLDETTPPAPPADTGAAQTPCAGSVCGDGATCAPIEACDDGNTAGGDGCTPACLLPAERSLADAEAELTGAGSDGAGAALAAGDVDGDGETDVLVAAETLTVASLVSGPFTADAPLSTATASFFGWGYRVAGADLDGDGSSDVVVTASSGASVWYGPAVGLHDIGSPDQALLGPPASAIASAGDVDEDGREDLVIGCGNEASHSGLSYLVRGQDGPSVDVTSGPTFPGEAADDASGVSVAGAGDVDGDGTPDLVIGAHRNDAGAPDAGAAYLLYGPLLTSVALADADQKWTGEETFDLAGAAVAGAGDLDGDGRAEVLVGAPDHRGDEGAAYVVSAVLGAPGTVHGLGTARVRLYGRRGDHAGLALAANGGDVWIGAPQHGTSEGAGAAYAVSEPAPGVVDLGDADFTACGEQIGDRAGWALAVVGDAIAIGAPGRGGGAGAVYLTLGP